jgi:chemotaxis protein methyltransferase CheR
MPAEMREEVEMSLLLEAILARYHYDFRGYSIASLKRRLKQAAERFDSGTFLNLRDRLLMEPAIFPQLLDYLTVQVSEMFRDPPFFRALREEVLPHLKTYPSLKVWIAGCSSGEELYSMAILFREEGLESRTIFYATDIHSGALHKAEAGIYSIERLAQFSKNYQDAGGKASLSDYFTAAYGNAVFDKTLRRQTVFSDHSLVSDSVFAEVHLVCCRNVLIYFDKELQNRAVGLFKDALVRRGFLALGAKEGLHLSCHKQNFAEISHGKRIYQKRG